MKNIIKKISVCTMLLALGVFGFITTNNTSAQNNREQANGHGTQFVTTNGDTVRRQFSFSANRRPDGTVKGNAVLHNPAFTGENGQRYQLQIDIVCMKVVGNIAILSGTVKRTNDPNLVNVASFIVEDNGEPGKNQDRISGVVFDDDDPNTPGDPQVCQNIGASDYDLNTIESGNIQVRGGTTP